MAHHGDECGFDVVNLLICISVIFRVDRDRITFCIRQLAVIYGVHHLVQFVVYGCGQLVRFVELIFYFLHGEDIRGTVKFRCPAVCGHMCPGKVVIKFEVFFRAVAVDVTVCGINGVLMGRPVLFFKGL